MDAELETSKKPRAPRLAVSILAIHAMACMAAAAGCYLAPQALFGPASVLPLPAFAIALLGASFLAIAVLLMLSIVGGDRRQLRKALVGLLLLDVQVPVAFNLNPASLEYLEKSTGIGWFWPSILFPLCAGVITLLIARLRSLPEQS
jgi:hypothetical protein